MLRLRQKLNIFCYSVLMAAVLFWGVCPGLLRAQSGNATLKMQWQASWAGYILYTPGYQPAVEPQAPFQSIEAQWTVPSALPTINCDLDPPESSDGSSIWIGLDGWGQTLLTNPWTDVLQAGTETDVPCWTGNPALNTAYFWVEWDGKKNIVKLPILVGDLVHVRIAATTTGANAWREATVYFDDYTEQTSYMSTFPAGCLICGKNPVQAQLFGNTAEWVAETTFYSAEDTKTTSYPNTLNDFGMVTVTDMSATDINGVVYTPGNPGQTTQEIDWMTVTGDPLPNGTLLACAQIMGPQQLLLSRAPYQIVTPGQQNNLEPKPQTCPGITQAPPPSTP